MTKFFYLLFCFTRPLSGAKHSCLQQEDFSSRLLPTGAASESVGLHLAENPGRSENCVSSLHSFPFSLALPPRQNIFRNTKTQ